MNFKIKIFSNLFLVNETFFEKNIFLINNIILIKPLAKNIIIIVFYYDEILNFSNL